MDIFDIKKPAKTSSADKNVYSSTGFASGCAGSSSTDVLGYAEGDTVLHATFGKGTVEKIESSPRDYKVTVNFDQFGVKKMLAGFAKLKKQ